MSRLSPWLLGLVTKKMIPLEVGFLSIKNVVVVVFPGGPP